MIQEFKGIINDVEFDRKDVFDTTEFIINLIENKFAGVEIEDKDFTEDLKQAIFKSWLDSGDLEYSEIEHRCMEMIDKANFINELQFATDINTEYFQEIDKKIADKKYSFCQ